MQRSWLVCLIAVFGLLPAVVGGTGLTATALVAKIPFDFTVADQPFPSGNYCVWLPLLSKPEVLAFGSQGRMGHRILTLGATPLEGNPSLEFRLYRYRDQNGVEQKAYFLFRVNPGSRETGRELVKSNSESAVEREARLRPLTSASGSAQSWRPEVVSVAASR